METSIAIQEYGEQAVKNYGEKTLKNRAIPSLMDGLKPVQRRILWAMHSLGLKANVKRMKAMRTVGETQGKYHPHADDSVYNAMVYMVEQPEPPIDGSGNWGSLTKPAAAPRYVEARLSEWGQGNFFDPDYVPIIEHMPNYDDSYMEPMQLPSKNLALLINGSRGIAMGASCFIPAFTKESVAAVLWAYLNGEEPEAETIADTLDFHTKYEGYVPETDANRKNLIQLINTGKGSIEHHPWWEMSGKTSIVITGFPTHLRESNAIDNVARHQSVKSVVDESNVENGVRYVVSLVRGTNIDESNIERILRPLIFRANYQLSYLTETMGEDGRAVVEFHTSSMKEMFERWIEWRKSLELRSLAYRITKTLGQIERLDLLLLAFNQRDILDACRDKDDPKAFLVKKLKITDEQADVLLGLTVRQLTRLANRDLIAEKEQNLKYTKSLKRMQKDVSKPIMQDLEEYLEDE